MLSHSTIQTLSVIALPLIFAITLHEAAHGWVAAKCGDKTAWALGRVSLNPMRHIDLLGTLILPFVTFSLSGIALGWAKPVPVNWNQLKHPRRDKAWVALAGPAANGLMALIWGLVGLLANSVSPGLLVSKTNTLLYFHYAALYGISINSFFMFLNLIPIPPLDGSRILQTLLPSRFSTVLEQIEPWGLWIVLALLLSGVLKGILWGPALGMSESLQALFHLY
jgi:Zn-dependent protease